MTSLSHSDFRTSTPVSNILGAVVSDAPFRRGTHPDVQDFHPKVLWMCPRQTFRVISRVVVKPTLVDTDLPVVLSLQVPSDRPHEPDLWHTLLNSTNRDDTIFGVRLLLARAKWGRDQHIPSGKVRKTRMDDFLFTTLLMLPSNLSLAYDWDFSEFKREAQERHDQFHRSNPASATGSA